MKTLQGMVVVVGLLVAIGSHQARAQAGKAAGSTPQIERGRYIVEIGGCNDCHTAGYAEAGGKAPENERLKGDTLGYRGPWGTTYPSNLRLSILRRSEDEWLKYARGLMTRPPMPWFNVRAMSESDLRAVYQYVKSLGSAGKEAPVFLPPNQAPKQPYVQWPGVR